jgi:small-conductance mechanosensitive channel
VPLPIALASASTGRIVATGTILAATVALIVVGEGVARVRATDRYTRVHVRRVVRYTTLVVAVFAVALEWRVFAGHAVLLVGLLSAGLAFSLQELVGAMAGWFNIVLGRLYRVGDRVQLAGVHGDVIDVSLLRTKLMEIGTAGEPLAEGETAPNDLWVLGRQYTGRIVALSNKTTFTEAVFNYSGVFDFIWEELRIGIPYNADWRQAESIMLDEARAISAGEGAQTAMAEMTRRYPVPAGEVEPQVYVTMTDNWVQLAARFVIPVRSSRTVKSDLTRRILSRFEQADIPVASMTSDVTLHPGRDWPRPPQ